MGSASEAPNFSDGDSWGKLLRSARVGLTWTIWQVDVPATAANRCFENSRDGACSTDPSSKDLAAMVPIQPA